MSQMLKSSGAMAVATMTSRVLGMVREIVYARFMGDGWVAAAFQLAFMIPNLFRRLLGEGALTAAFIPIFKEKEKNYGPVEMWRATNAVVCGLVLAAGVIIVAVVAGVSLWLHFARELPRETRLMLELLRIMFPYMLLVCLAAVFMGVLNARGYFFIPAMGATVLNVVMIASVLLLAPRLGTSLETQIFALAIGVIVAGLGQAGFQLPTLFKEGFRFEWVSPMRNETVARVIRQMIPGTLGVAAFQINVLLTQTVAFAIDPPVVASFNYAVRLMELPQGVFGISLATYLLPTLAGLAAEKKWDQYRHTLHQGLLHMIFINMFASVMLVVLAEPIVRLLFERGRFGPDSTLRVAFALQCLAPGLVAFSGVNILARAFYAVGDTATPMKISIVCLGLNLIIACMLLVVFPPGYKQGAPGLANTLTAFMNLAGLAGLLRRKLQVPDPAQLRRDVLIVLGGTLLAGVVAWSALHTWAWFIPATSIWSRIGAVFTPLLIAGVGYCGFCVSRKCTPAVESIHTFLGRFGRA